MPEPPDSAPDSPDYDPTIRQSMDRVDTQFGPYRLLGRVGEGAMGEVWRAEQREPVKRIVALKLIKRGMDTREVITRFEIERQAMALMEHPSIAKVYDAGETDDGRPYIAMEYIAGDRITDYCEKNKLTIDARLKLFQKVCYAIQHAHQKAVIHRDLKPSNILVVEVDGEPTPKVIDFGIAKATAQSLTERSMATYVGQLLGTPLYMSPEQAGSGAAAVDTRADVYSLGVILYELLSGALPHDPEKMARAALPEILKVLREEAAPRPSTRVSTLGDRTAEIAAHRGLDGKKLVGKLRGDLDWITLKALEKDRKRRYETPGDLADDLARYLHSEVVGARPPSRTYRLSRFVRRHRVGVTITALTVVVLLAGSVWQNVLLGIVTAERDRALANERLLLAGDHTETDPTVALAYVLASLEITELPGARDILRRAIAAGPLRDQLPLPEGLNPAVSIDVSGDGRLCAAAFHGPSRPVVAICELETGEWRILEGPGEHFAFFVRFSRDARFLAAAAGDGFHFWRVSDGQYLSHELDEEQKTVLRGDWYGTGWPFEHEDPGRFYLSTSPSGQPTTWYDFDVTSGTLRRLGESPSRGTRFPSIDASGTVVADYMENEAFTQRVDDLDTRTKRSVGRLAAPLSIVVLDPDGRTLVGADAEGGVRAWDLSPDPARLLHAHQDVPNDEYNIVIERGGQRFLTTWFGSTARLHEIGEGPPRAPVSLLERSPWTQSGDFLPDGSLITSHMDTPLSRWHIPWVKAWSIRLDEAMAGPAISKLSADGSALVVWRKSGGLLRVPLSGKAGTPIEELASLLPWSRGFTNVLDFSADLRRVLVHDGYLKGAVVLDVESGTELGVPEEAGSYLSLAMSPSGSRVALLLFDDELLPRGIRVVDLDDAADDVRIATAPGAVRAASFVDEQALVCLQEDVALRFHLDPAGAAPDTLWSGRTTGDGILIPGGRSAIIRDDAGEVEWIDFSTGKTTLLPDVSQGEFLSADHATTLDLIALAGSWNSIRVFEKGTGRTWTLPGPTDYVRFDPQGRWLIAGQGENTTAWRLPLDPLLEDVEAEELTRRIQAATNVRVVPAAESAQAYRVTSLGEIDR